MRYYCLLLLLLSGCGNNLHIEAKYQPYVTAFEKRSITYGNPVQITNLKICTVPTITPNNVIAQCFYYITPTIKVSEEFWSQMDVYLREQVLFHEIGHCILHRGHRSDLNNNIPLSIMNPYELSADQYKNNYVQYMHELFFANDLQSELPLKYISEDKNQAVEIEALFAPYEAIDAN